MATAISTETFVIVQDNSGKPAVAILQQWLEARGHHVRRADTAEAAIAMVADALPGCPIDLLVLSLSEPSEQSAAIDRLALLPAAQRPRHVAILSDEEPDFILRRRLPGTRLHLLGQPLHALGLLDVARRITSPVSRG